jgi:hypothetical protein
MHRRILALAFVLTGTVSAVAGAQVIVWVDFTSDIHNGLGGGPNGKADWLDELDKCTTAAGVTAFAPAEVAVIEAGILADLAAIYAGYTISFTTTVPGVGPFDAIAYGKTSFGFGALGTAPVDFGNIASGQVGGIASGNFGFILDEFTGSASRPTQIDQITRALAGTGAHELGHTLGLYHHHSYSNQGITPATYAGTGGLQNLHIMATGETGLTESGRETLRSLAPWERACLDAAGGAAAGFPGFDNQKMVASPVLIDLSETGPGMDAGGTPATATTLSFTPGATSGFDLSFIAGDIDGGPGDVDVYRLFVTTPSFLMAEIFSERRFAAPFSVDLIMTLLDSMGTPLMTSDDLFYVGDTFGSGPFEGNDPYILNIPLAAPGVYYLAITGSPMPSLGLPAIGDTYWLLTGLAPIPEPSTVALLLLAGCSGGVMRRRAGRRHGCPGPGGRRPGC